MVTTRRGRIKKVSLRVEIATAGIVADDKRVVAVRGAFQTGVSTARRDLH